MWNWFSSSCSVQYLLNTFSAPLQNNCPWSGEYVYFLLFTIYYSIYEYDKRVRKKTYGGQQKWALEQLLKISLMLSMFYVTENFRYNLNDKNMFCCMLCNVYSNFPLSIYSIWLSSSKIFWVKIKKTFVKFCLCMRKRWDVFINQGCYSAADGVPLSFLKMFWRGTPPGERWQHGQMNYKETKPYM